ncbi:MAG: phytoene desaturase family protein [Chitinophagaceae bacterium]|nr:phytoene desaturase family protein [Chitinophagaceae bacterium]
MFSGKKIIVIGSGFAGLSAATFLAHHGFRVTVLEKNAVPGGRAARLEHNGFTFDMGPSFYWMPDVFERYFSLFGKKVSDYYTLLRLNPSYRIYWEDGYTDIPAGYQALQSLFETLEPGSAKKLDAFLKEAEYKYKVGMNNLVYKPSRSVTEFLNWPTLTGMMKLQVFTSIRKHIARYFSHPRLRQMLEFPVLFLGALPQNTPALYSLMNYADIRGGTWYPLGGMYAVVEGMHRLAKEKGVEFRFNHEVSELRFSGNVIKEVVANSDAFQADAVISTADYYFTETHLLPEALRSYSEKYWDKRIMAPSALLYYVGLGKKLKNITHHALFFDVPFERHAEEIYSHPQWPTEPLFYVSVPSVTDTSVAPAGCENIVILIPVASGLAGDDEEIRKRYFLTVVSRMERIVGEDIGNSVIFMKSYSVSDFKRDYHSFKGNAYGLANTLFQTALFRPACRSKKVKNLFYAGQLTVPGPGVPPALISGEVAANYLRKKMF